jgi:hypothetical protein
MPLPLEIAHKLYRRLTQLEKAPPTDEAVAEIVKALATAPDQATAERFVDEWIKNSSDFPKPMHIYHTFHPPGALPAVVVGAPPKCAICSDTGHVTFQKNGLDFARPCTHKAI